MSTFYSVYHNVRSSLTPVLTHSKFIKSGVLTPEEFVAAGDYLVKNCPTWQWVKSSPTTSVDYLPMEKSFLVSRNVPCIPANATVETTSGGWENISTPKKVILDLSEEEERQENEDEDDEDDDPSMVVIKNNLLSTRTYTIYITYDRYYQTPRMWLNGFAETGNPLQLSEILQDISAEHAKKTVTVEQFPFENWIGASIHPCQHASAIKHLTRKIDCPRVELYIIYFLKLMSSVIPQVSYDFSFQV